MASSSSGAALVTASSSQEKDNFFRLSTLIIDGGTKLLREVFNDIHPPASLPTVLAKPTTEKDLKKAIRYWERKKLYLPGGGFGTSEEFDISLLFKLLKSICGLTPPSSGNWDERPDPAHKSQTDDLVRIKFHRNETYAHVKEMKLEDADFQQIWNELSSAMIRLAKCMSSAKEREWKNIIDSYSSAPLTSKEEVYVGELEAWYDNDKELKEEIEKLGEELEAGIGEVKKVTKERSERVLDALSEEMGGVKKEMQDLKDIFREQGFSKRKLKENQLLEKRLKNFQEDVRPVDLLPYLSCLTETDKQQILADKSDHGTAKANQTLVECIKRKDEGFVQFVRALKRTDYGHVALLFDPKETIDPNDEEGEHKSEEDGKWLTIIGTAIDVRFSGIFCVKVGGDETCSDLEVEVAEKFADPSSRQSKELRKKLQEFLPRGVAFVRTEKGSVVSVFRISSLTGAEKLWQMYKDGNLEPKLQELLLDEFEAKDLTYQVNFPAERYERIHRKLKEIETKQEAKSKGGSVFPSEDGDLEPKLQELLLDKFEAKDLTYQVNFPAERYERIHRKLKEIETQQEAESASGHVFPSEETETQKEGESASRHVFTNAGDASEVMKDAESPFEFNIPPVYPNENDLGALELNLREYQKELAAEALQGHNSIICAPTNSGKTYVAVHIAKEHLNAFSKAREEAASEGVNDQKAPKVVFIVSTVNLVSQQKERFQLYIDQPYKVSDISGGNATEIPLKYLLENDDVVVMTAQILVNALNDKKHEVALSDISLLIFDECHHAQNEHPYNKIMEKYLALKLQPGTQHKLPQVVALTASLGVGKTDSIVKATEHILQVCANLDAKGVSTVREHEEELSRFVNKPNRNVFGVSRNGPDKFEEVINQVMKSIEKDIGQVNPSAPANRSSQGYRQWLEELYKNAVKRGERYSVTYAEQLREYHVALEINNSSRMKDARKSLEKYFSKLDEGKFTAIDKKLKQRYSRAKDALEEYVQIHGEPHNPNLLELKKLIFKFEEDSRKESEDSSSQTKSKGIVFTRTRESTQALFGWIQETEELKAILRPEIIVGSGGKSESGMTQHEQVDAIKKFKTGEANILLATSVAEEGLDISDCNYVIRYNVMSNEISSVQSRGRVRAEEGKYAILASAGSGVLKKESLNQFRELLMVEAVSQVQQMQQMEPEEFKKKVGQLQRKAFEDRNRKKKARKFRKSEFRPDDVTFLCRKCKIQACQAHDLRIIRETYRVNITRDFQEKVTLKPHSKKRKLIDGVLFKTKVHCKECDEDWGVTVVIDGKEWICLQVSGFLLQYADGVKRMHKKWKDVLFEVPEITPEDEEEEEEEED